MVIPADLRAASSVCDGVTQVVRDMKLAKSVQWCVAGDESGDVVIVAMRKLGGTPGLPPATDS